MMSGIVEQLADQLEREYGSCPAPRAQLLAWVDDQLNRVSRLQPPGDAALAMINSSYVEWRAELLGIDTTWENAPAVGLEFGAMSDLKVPDDFDQEDSEIQQLFEGQDDEKSD